MKIILLKNVPDLGQKGDVKEVKPGYWRNFLLPHNLAGKVTENLIKELNKRKSQEQSEKSVVQEKQEKELKELNDKVINVELKAGKTGSLFSGLDSKKISRLIKEKLDLHIPAELINIEKPIKQIGSHKISAKNAIFKLEITAQHSPQK